MTNANHPQMFDDMMAFLRTAGAYALRAQGAVQSHLKPGEQIVTETDLAVARRARERLGHWFERDGHILIEEESLDTLPSPQEVFASTEYQWVLDPIDGTAGYAMGRGLWGITLGILKNGAPLMGGIIQPRQHRLIASDGTQVFCEELDADGKPFRFTPTARAIETINSQTFFDGFFDFRLLTSHEQTTRMAQSFWNNTPESAVDGLYNALSGRSAGALITHSYSLWDFAGGAAIARATGHVFRNGINGIQLERFGHDTLKPNWKSEVSWIVSHPDNYAQLKGILTGG